MKISVLGCGSLGSSIIEGLVKSRSFPPERIIASDIDREKLSELKKLGVETTSENIYAVENANIIYLTLKPDVIGPVLDELNLTENKLLVSMAAGVSTKYLDKHTNARIIRVMPNICGSVTEMASAYTLGPRAKKKDEKLIKNTLDNLGKTIHIEETLMNGITGLNGSGPAFIFLVIEAMKNAGKNIGLSEKDALKLAAQTVQGSGKLVLNSDKSLEELIAGVCTPEGATIEGVKVLEKREVQKAFEDAVCAAAEKTEELSE